MCGRYNLELKENFPERFKISDNISQLKSRYNIAPSQENPVVVSQSPNRVEMMKWGLVPFWSKDGKDQIINVKAESAGVKPMFKKLIQFQRCLVPATGFYEWQRLGKEKIPYNIRLKSHEYFSLAGLWDTWKSNDGKEIKTYAIITTIPNDLMVSIHNRMPVILKKEDEDQWLNHDNAEIDDLLKYMTPYPSDEMEAYPISSRVNSPINDDEGLLKPSV